MSKARKIKFPNWKGLHMDSAIYWLELFKLNPKLTKKSNSFQDFCRRVSPNGKLSLGAHMAKHKWAENVFIAFKLDKWTASPLAFPTADKVSDIFNADGSPKPELKAWLKDNMLSDLRYYFRAVKRTDGILILAQYDQIIGSRYLALLPVNQELPIKAKGWLIY